MGAAPYRFDVALTDDETPVISLEWKMSDGTAFPWAAYRYEYAIGDAESCSSRILTSDSGALTPDPTNDRLTIDLGPAALQPGRYRHGCRVIEIATGRSIQIFDGGVTISEGNF